MKSTVCRLMSLVLVLSLLLGGMLSCEKPEKEPDTDPVVQPDGEVAVATPSIVFSAEPQASGMTYFSPEADALQKMEIGGENCWIFQHFRQQQTNILYLSLEESARPADTSRMLATFRVYVSEKLTISVNCSIGGEMQTVTQQISKKNEWIDCQVELPGLVLDGGVDGYDMKVVFTGPELIRLSTLSIAPVDKLPSELAAEQLQAKYDGMEDLVMGLFTGTSTEVIEDNLRFGAEYQMHFPDFIRVGDEIYAYYIGADDNGKMGTCLATSKDGITFTRKGVVLNADQKYDTGYAAFAGIWYDDLDQLFYMVYEAHGDGSTGGQDIALAVSIDGLTFEKQGVILDEDDCPPSWCRANVGTPDLYKEGDVWYVFFHGYNGVDCQIGVAYGEDLFKLTVHPDPIIPTTADPEAPDSGTTGRRDVIRFGDTYYMVYEVSSDKYEGSYGKAKWTHMFAYSKDLINWTVIDAPILDQGDRRSMGYDGPAWLVLDGEVYVYFRVCENGNFTRRARIVAK